MSDIEDAYNRWLDQVTDTVGDQASHQNDHVLPNLTVITEAPRFRWVTKLPACLQFNWLFRVDHVEKYANVCPISIGYHGETSEDIQASGVDDDRDVHFIADIPEIPIEPQLRCRLQDLMTLTLPRLQTETEEETAHVEIPERSTESLCRPAERRPDEPNER